MLVALSFCLVLVDSKMENSKKILQLSSSSSTLTQAGPVLLSGVASERLKQGLFQYLFQVLS